MAELADILEQPFQTEFQKLQGRQEPAFIQTLRQSGVQRFTDLGLPHRRQEAWRFTDISAFTGHQYRLAQPVPLAADRLPVRSSADAIRLVFVNGHYSPSLSDDLSALPHGVTVTTLSAAATEQADVLTAALGQAPVVVGYPFSALNDALFTDGVVVHIAAGILMEHPLELVHCLDGQAVAAYPRNLIVLERGAQATIIEEHQGQGRYFTCPQTEVLLADAAVCRYHKLQQEAAEAWHLGSLRCYLGRDSQLSAHLVSAGGRLNRTEIMARLDGEGADCEFNGLSLVEDGQLADYHVCMEHAKPHGSSRQVFKSILNGKSRAVFDGLIKVVEQAQKTDASQTCRNLLLSRQALANANPRLEILADDVKCAHGATIGYLDPDALFYLRSRGISEAEAHSMLVFAFANEQLESLDLLGLRQRLEALLVERYYPSNL